MPVLRLADVTVRAPSGALLLDSVSLALESGEMVALVGPSGAGKTTLIEAASGLRNPDSGEMLTSGVRRSGREEHRGPLRVVVALQSPERMFFMPTVAAEVGFALQRLAVPAAERHRRVLDAMGLVGLSAEYLERHPSSLSGGEQRLVALASVLVAEPDVLILDEPTAGLTAGHAEQVVALLGELRARGTAVLLATHEIDTFASVVDRVVVLHRGAIIADGSPTAVYAGHQLSSLVGFGVPVPLETLLASPGALARSDVEELEHGSTLNELRQATGRARLLSLPGIAVGLPIGLLLAVAFLSPLSLSGLMLIAAALPAVALLTGSSLASIGRLLLPVVVLATLAAMAHLLVPSSGIDDRQSAMVVGPVGVSGESVEPAARSWFRVVGPVLAGLVMAGSRPVSATARELRQLLAALPLARGWAQAVGLVVMLAARLVPLMRGEVVRIERAQRARGAGAGRSIGSRIRLLASIAVPALASALLRAERLAVALEVRGWSGGQHPAREPLVRRADLIWLLAACALLVLAVAAGLPG